MTEKEANSIEAKKGVGKKVLGFAFVALGVLNSLFAMKAGVTERSYLNVALIGAGALLFFAGMRQARRRGSK